ncbi:hypothetical protein [Thermodesulfovibrio hydrogeniphilus]
MKEFFKLFILIFSLIMATTNFLYTDVTFAKSYNPEQQEKKEASKVTVKEVVRAKFGSGPNDIGIVTPPEANPEGPMSFDLGAKGEIYILDQINSRIQVFKEGKRVRTIPIPFRTFMDIDVLPNGKIVLLDNQVKKAVYFLEPDGKVINHIPLEGENVSYAPEVTGIYSIHSGDMAGVWLNLGVRSVRIASLEGKPFSERINVPGILTPDGKHLMSANRIGDITAIIYYSQEKFSIMKQYTVEFDMYVDYLLGIWSDCSGRIYLGAMLIEEPKSSKLIVVLTSEGNELGRVELFLQKMPHEIYQPIRVSPEGDIYQMTCDKKGVFIRKYSLLR